MSKYHPIEPEREKRLRFAHSQCDEAYSRLCSARRHANYDVSDETAALIQDTCKSLARVKALLSLAVAEEVAA